MKRLLLTVVCVSLLSGGVLSVQAKPFSPDEGRGRPEMKMHDSLAQKLNLTEEQKAKADKIRKDGREKMKPLMQEKKELHEKMDKLRKENMEEFEKILTDEQKEAFEKFKKEHRPHPGMHHKGGKGHPFDGKPPFEAEPIEKPVK